MDEEKKDIEKLVEDAKKAVEKELNQNENVQEIKEENLETNTEEKKEYNLVKIKKKRNYIPLIIITVLICSILFFSVIFALINIGNDKILSGVSIMGIDVSKLSQQEATDKLNEIIQSKCEDDITLKYKDYETTVNGKQINAKFDVEKAVNEAYNIGKGGNILVNNYNILITLIQKKDISMDLYYDDGLLSTAIEGISSKMPDSVKQSSYYVEDDNVIIVKGKSGVKVKEDTMKEEIVSVMKKIEEKNIIITIPVETVEPDAIDVEKIRNEIYKAPQDAYVSSNPTTVHTHVNGVDFNISIEEAKKLLEEDKEEYKIPLKITVPKIKVENLGEKAFPDLLATYTTRYDPTNKNRSNNLTIAAGKINGTILMPGEIFSYNKVVGARTIAAGYKEAGAYAGGKVVKDVGGGICQISSTIYNTALLANLEIVDRSNHQFLTSYVPVSRDATVSWGGLDFKFKNTRTYPIKIVASAKNGLAKVSFYGIKEETEYEVVIQSKTLSYIPYTVKYIEDSSLAKGKEVVSQSGYNGCKSEAYRVLKLNGKVVSKTLLSRDTYDPMQRIIRRGTKKTITKKNDTKKDESANKVKNTQSNVVDGEN